MNYHRNRKLLSKPVVGVLLLIFALYILVQVPMPKFLVNITHQIGKPIWGSTSILNKQFQSITAFVVSNKSLREENRLLKEELESIRITELSQNLLREENNALKEILGRKSDRETLLAAILSRPNKTIYDTLVIDTGNNNNVRKGERVIINNIVLGEISKVLSNTSVVTLFSSPGIETDVLIGPDDVSAKAVGRGGGNFEILLPRDIDIVVGDTIIMPGINSELFAIVEHVIVNPTDSFQKILFKNPVNIFEIKFVEIVRKTQ